MANYYFVGTFLTPLSFEARPEMTFAQLDRLLRDNLTERDYDKTRQIRRFYDLLNLRSFWKEESFDPVGEMSEPEVEEALATRCGFPGYVYDYIDSYPTREQRIEHFSFLFAKFFQTYDQVSDPFIRKFLTFERELRLVMVAFRARKLGRDLNKEFQYENLEEDLIGQLLAQKDDKEFQLPEKFQELREIFERDGNDPLALQKALDVYRFNTIESWVDLADTFSIERILAYLTQFILVENWFKLDREKGIQIIDTLVKEY